MLVERRGAYMVMHSGIFFDYEESFCGRPYIYLSAHKTGEDGWPPSSIGIALRDQDDFDISLVYYPGAEDFMTVWNELANWMRDHEQGVSHFDAIRDAFSFFPDCGCKREVW